MSNASNDLVLHLKLDTIIPDGGNQRVRSALTENFLASSENVSAFTESQYRSHGNPQVVPDEHFGSCFTFDGNNDFVELSPTTIPTGNEITVCFWANGGNNLPNTNSIVFAHTPKNSRVLCIHLPWSDGVIYFDCGGNPNVQDSGYDRISKSIGTGQDAVQYKGKWNHWAFTKDVTKGEMKIYLNGVLWHNEEGKTQPILPAAKAYIAKNYPGQIANFRTYKKALFPEEIKQDMNDDLTAITAFNLAYPLDFDLYEGDNKESIIFIENDTKGEELVFEIQNDTEQGITLPAKSGAVTQNNYHFELRFRPDTLSPKSLQQLALKTQSNWSMSSPVTQADGIVSLYFLTTNTTLSANEVVTLTLPNVSASAAGGARTTRVEFLCPEFTYQGETLTHYYREKKLSVIDHRGKKNIPLHVSFVGSNRILNDGTTTNKLTLRIVNVLKDKSIPLIPDSKGDNASKFIISFDVQEANQNKDWALGTTSQVAGISIKYKGKEIINSGQQGESPEWVILFNDQTAIEPSQDIQVELSGIVSSLAAGQTNLYIRYENIPGYWDGTFICTIEKTPILYKDGKVGIGIIPNSQQSEQLTVQGNTAITGNLTVFPRIGIGSSDFSKEPLVIRATQRQESLIAFEDPNGTKKWHIEQNYNGDTPGLNFVETGVADFRLFLKSGGNVGIGTKDPRSGKLVIQQTKENEGIVLCHHQDKSKTFQIGFQTDGTLFFYIYNNESNPKGQYMTSDGKWNLNSDISVKQEISSLNSILNQVIQLNPVRFIWKDTKLSSVGFIAQEVAQIFPELVSSINTGKGELKGLAYTDFGVLAIASIKEVAENLQELKQKYDDLAIVNQDLQRRLEKLENRD